MMGMIQSEMLAHQKTIEKSIDEIQKMLTMH